MLRDWWTAHRIEVYADLILIGVAILVGVGWLLWSRRKKKVGP